MMISYEVLGVLVAISGNFLISVALNLQRKSHESAHANYLTDPEWWAGFSLMSVGEIGNFIAYGLAPVSTVSPLGVTTIISNIFIAPLMFNQPLQKRELLGTLIAVLGVLLIVFSTISSDVSAPINDVFLYVEQILKSWNLIIYILISFTIILILLYIVVPRTDSTKYLFANLCAVALFGSYTATATKLLAAVIEFSSPTQFLTNLTTFFLLSVVVVTSICQIKYLNKTLKMAASTRVIPIHFALFTLCTLSASIVIFKDFEGRSIGQVLVFVSGCGLTSFGVSWIGRAPLKVSHIPQIVIDPVDDAESIGQGSLLSNVYSNESPPPSLLLDGQHNVEFHRSMPQLVPSNEASSLLDYYSRRKSFADDYLTRSPVATNNFGIFITGMITREDPL